MSERRRAFFEAFAWAEDVRIGLGMEFGPAGPYVVDRLFDRAGPDFAFVVGRAQISRDTFTTPEVAWAILHRASDLQAIHDLRVEGHFAGGNLNTDWIDAIQVSRARLLKRRRIDPVTRRRVMRAYGFACAGCGYALSGDWTHYDGTRAPTDEDRMLHLDHVVPLARGGADTESNLQVLCAPCNWQKGAR